MGIDLPVRSGGDLHIWGESTTMSVKEPECPLATSAGGCPPDCRFCDTEAQPVTAAIASPVTSG